MVTPTTAQNLDTPSTDFGGFEGPEKLLEIWFAPAAEALPIHQIVLESKENLSQKLGFRSVTKESWAELLKLVNCEILSVISNEHIDAYLLSESSLFVYPHKLVLKTCGTTTLLKAVPDILSLAKELLKVTRAYRVFYSRKAFMFPEKQLYPHCDWKDEVAFLDEHFDNGAPYVIGRTNGDHWFLYTTPSSPYNEDLQAVPAAADDDCTIEILMTGLSRKAAEPFYLNSGEESGHIGGSNVALKIGLSSLYSRMLGDAFLFQPCGFSMNALREDHYFNVHVTPEPHCSYASFEANLPIPEVTTAENPNLTDLISKVIAAYDPAQFTVTLFKSQNSFQAAVAPPVLPRISGFKQVDNILYDFDGYHLRYGHFKSI